MIKPKDYTILEKSFQFKKSYLKSTNWWVNIALLGPFILLFGSLFCIMYLFNNGQLATWYTAPYIVVFVIATIWLKTARKHIQKGKVNKDGSYLVCIAQPIGELNGYVYNIFVTNNRRHDKKYIENLARNIQNAKEIIEEYKSEARQNSVLMHHETADVDYFLRAYFNDAINKRNADWRADDYFPILFIDKKNTPIIKKRHLLEYS